jgi:hypothetical protein
VALAESRDGGSNASIGCAGRLADLLKTLFPSVAARGLRLLAGGHSNQNGRPDIPGTEEKKSQRKKNAPNSTLRPGQGPCGVRNRLFFAARAA